MLKINIEDIGQRLAFPFTTRKKCEDIRVHFTDYVHFVDRVNKHEALINYSKWKPWTDLTKPEIRERIKEMRQACQKEKDKELGLKSQNQESQTTAYQKLKSSFLKSIK